MKRIICIFLCVLMLLAVIPLSVFAEDTIISSLDLTYNEAAVTFNTAYTEGECKNTMLDNISVTTPGTKIDGGNGGLMIRNYADTDWWGIGNGSNQADAGRKYALCFCIQLSSGYTWLEEITTDTEKHSIADFPGFTLNLNGEKITDVEFAYNDHWNLIKFYVPIGSPSAEPCIKSVDIAEKNVSVVRGESYGFEAVIDGTADNKNIVWEILSAVSPDTIISEGGTLFIAEDETAETIVIKASSEFDGNKSSEATVTVLSEKPTIELELNESNISVYKGKSYIVYITVSGTQTNRELVYTLSGATSDKTYLGNDETVYESSESSRVAKCIYVGSDEGAQKLTFTATSKADNTKSVSVDIDIKDTEKLARIDLKYDSNVIKFKTSDTEGIAQGTARTAIGVETDGVRISNSYLTYKTENWNGIGDGTGLVDKSKKYALEYYMELTGSGIDWPEVFKSDEQAHSIADIEGFEVYVNGEKRTDVEYEYNNYWNSVRFFVFTDILVNGFVEDNGKTYYYVDGEMVTSKLMTIAGKKYYFGKDGAMYTSKLISVSGKKYYVGKDGAAYTKKLISVSGKKYYMGADGVAYTKKLISVNGKKYYMGADGVAYTSKLISVSGKKYYMGSDGVAYTSKLISVSGKKYYMGKDGVAYKSKLISVSGKKYYIGSDCVAYKSKFASLSGKKYYFGSDCVMYKSKTFSVNGVKWKADKNGVCKKA